MPGFVFLEIDGLAEPVLRDAIARGYMPTLKRWLDSGSHTLVRWDPDLSAQTSASQAGILLGSNEGHPRLPLVGQAAAGAARLLARRQTAHTLEEALSTGNGLLAHGGAGRWNAFSGNAVDNIGVYSVFGDDDPRIPQSAPWLSHLALHDLAHPHPLPHRRRPRVVAGVAATAQTTCCPASIAG